MSRVRMPGRLRGYSSSPDFAWSGWRYRIPGGPVGGQYHGFIAPDSSQSWEGGGGGWPFGASELTEGPQKRPSGHSLLPQQGTSKGPWEKEWGGTAFREGQTHSDYVFRSPGETRPRPNASGGANVITGKQTTKSAGYAEAPGNYAGLGLVPSPPARRGYFPIPGPGASTGVPRYPVVPYTPPPGPSIGPRYPIYTGPDYQPVTTIPSNSTGATSAVAQPAPYAYPPQYIVPWTSPPISPTPAPTVAASPADFLPSQGQIVPGVTPGVSPLIDTMSAPTSSVTATATTTDAFSTWLQAQTIIPGVANQWVALGGILALFLMKGGKK